MLNKIKKAFEVFSDFKRQVNYMIVSPLSRYYYNINTLISELYKDNKEIEHTAIAHNLVAGTASTKACTEIGIETRRQ